MISELEAAGLRPDDLRVVDDPRARGVATLWAALDTEAGIRWTRARIVAEATAELAHEFGLEGPVVAVVTADTPVLELELLAVLAVLAGAQVWVHSAHPLDSVLVRRFEGGLGEGAAAALGAPPARDATSSLSRLQAEPTGTHEPRPLDPSLSFERYVGVDREIDAAARWVAEQVLEGVPFEEVAVLCAEGEPFPQLVADRVRAIDAEQPIPVYVAGGLPLAGVRGRPRGAGPRGVGGAAVGGRDVVAAAVSAPRARSA